MNGELKVKKTFSGFSGVVNTGKFSLFLVLDKNGSNVSLDQLLLTCINYNHIIVKGVSDDEIFEQHVELSKLVKKVIDKNPNIQFELHTLGRIKPNGFTKINNIKFIVNIELKNTGRDYKERVVDKSIKWFNEFGATFLFYINDKDDFDELNLIINDFGIKKSSVYLAPYSLENNILSDTIEIAKTTGFNITMDFSKALWDC